MKRLTVLSFFSVLVVFAVMVSSAVQAQESDDDFTFPPEYVAQRPLSNAGMQIQDIIRDNDLTGLLGIRLDNENFAVLVHWHGEVPSEISDFIAGSDVTITIVNVPYSKEELIAEIDRISVTRQHGNITLNTIGINDTFDGIRIGFETPGEGTQAEKIQAAKSEISSDFPLTFEVRGPLTALPGRWDYQNPVWDSMAMPGWGVHFLILLSPALLAIGLATLVFRLRKRR